MLITPRDDVIRFCQLIEAEKYNEAISYGLERINEDPNDEANIRYGLMSACVITKNSKVAEEVAEKIADVMGKASARFFKENNIKPARVRKTWLDHLHGNQFLNINNDEN